jgi:hypothetical protein
MFDDLFQGFTFRKVYAVKRWFIPTHGADMEVEEIQQGRDSTSE